MAKHSEKMGRWGTEVAKATDSHEYFVLMEISHASREPLNHILLHLQKKLRDDELRTGTTRLSSLVCAELEEITEEYVELFNDPKWDPDGDLVQGLVSIWPDQFFAGLATLLTNSYCEYVIVFLIAWVASLSTPCSSLKVLQLCELFAELSGRVARQWQRQNETLVRCRARGP